MNIIVTNHAVQRFKERVFTTRKYNDEEVIKRLETVAKKGKVIRKEPGNAKRIKFENIYVVTTNDRDGNYVVLTCLGDKKLVSWHTSELRKRYQN